MFLSRILCVFISYLCDTSLLNEHIISEIPRIRGGVLSQDRPGASWWLPRSWSSCGSLPSSVRPNHQGLEIRRYPVQPVMDNPQYQKAGSCLGLPHYFFINFWIINVPLRGCSNDMFIPW